MIWIFLSKKKRSKYLCTGNPFPPPSQAWLHSITPGTFSPPLAINHCRVQYTLFFHWGNEQSRATKRQRRFLLLESQKTSDQLRIENRCSIQVYSSVTMHLALLLFPTHRTTEGVRFSTKHCGTTLCSFPLPQSLPEAQKSWKPPALSQKSASLPGSSGASHLTALFDPWEPFFTLCMETYHPVLNECKSTKSVNFTEPLNFKNLLYVLNTHLQILNMSTLSFALFPILFLKKVYFCNDVLKFKV